MIAAATLKDLIAAAPEPHDPDAARLMREALGARLAAFPEPAQALIGGIAGCSPYLRRLMQAAPDLVFSCLETSPEASLDAAITALNGDPDADEAAQMRNLRYAKRRAALSIALADIGGVWDVMAAASALSRFADAAVEAALGLAVKGAGLASCDGVVMLAMGKHGAQELNYSSDIDLIALFDRDRMGVADRAEAQAAAVKITRKLVSLLQTQTPDGYVFRTDLRLRPDPGASALAVSVQSAEAYYEAYGQNWERMAFIKARPCAGDIALGEDFLATLRPFIWRKYLDFAAIEDIHAVKKQIHAAKGGAAIEFEGHDVKLGRGGIREIEFYVQTQQLIVGGKNPDLRPRASLDALEALCAAGHIGADARDDLAAAYRYFRHVEHRLQMINDEQTHRLPREADALERLRLFAGEASAGAFRDRMTGALQTVETRYAELFETGDEPAPAVGSLVFTGVDDHPATLDTLARLGFSRGGEISAAIRRWHRGGLRATRTERARALLTKLIPPLLEALSNAADPDDAFFAFEGFLKSLPSGVQVFSLLLNNLEVFDALIRIITLSPYLGRELSKQINFIEQLLENNWKAPLRETSVYDAICAEAAERAETYESALNAVRRQAGELRFKIAARLALGLTSHEEAARRFTALAEACVRALTPAAMREFSRQHGNIAGEMVVIGLGRLGGGEMSATSDIDVMFVYDAPAGAMSDGPRSLAASEYSTRFVRRLVTALAAATEEGALYEVDMQLRPSGRAGPAAVNFTAFRQYYEQEAWTWELMALVKARVIASSSPDPAAPLGAKVAGEIERILARPRERPRIAADVAAMRARLLEAKPAESPWDVKHIVGGLTDIAFVCQYLALVSASRLGPAPRHTGAAMAHFAKNGELPQETAAQLQEANAMFEAALHLGRAATGGVFAPEKAGEALRARMAAVCGAQNAAAAETSLTKLQSNIAQYFHRIIEAAGAPDAAGDENSAT